VTTSSTSPPSSASAVDAPLAGTPVHALWTGRDHGDARRPEVSVPPPAPADLVVRRARQVHGGAVLVVDPGPVPASAKRWTLGRGDVLPDGDALVGREPGTALAVLTADCAPVALGSPEGVHAAVHVGWRGLGAGVLGHAIDAMRSLGASAVVAGIGPCIGGCCYEFSVADLDRVEAVVGAPVRAMTTWGTPSLDLAAAVRAQLARSDTRVAVEAHQCTACVPGHYSYRGHGDSARQAVYVWRAP
jgi:polyphenol oxidase